MTDRRGLAVYAAAGLASAALLPLLMHPRLALVTAAGITGVVLARRSVAYPLALAGIPPVIFAIFGPDPLPKGVVTAVVAGSVALAAFLAVVGRGDTPPLRAFFAVPVVITFALLAVMLLTLGDSPDPETGTIKLQLFLAGNVVFLLGGVFIGWRPEQLALLLALMLAVAIAGAVVLVLELVTGTAQEVLPSRFVASAENDPISLGRASATGLLIAICFVMSSRAAPLRLLAAGAVPVLAAAMIAAGSRGPVVGLGFGLVVLLALGVSGGAGSRRLFLVVASLLGALLVVVQVVPDSSITRSVSFVTADFTLSSNGRTQLWSTAWDVFSAHPLLGIGTGGFAALPGSDLYPHNLFLESAAELGAVGLGLAVIFVTVTAVRTSQVWRRTQGEERLMAAAVLALFAAATSNALFSGAIPNNRAMWLWAGVGSGMAARALRRTAPATARFRTPPAARLARQHP